VDYKKVQKEFPILSRKINGNRLVYLDNAATTQKPKVVIDAISNFYSEYNSNIHRGICTLSEEATKLYEDSRKRVANFIGAVNSEEVVFTRGTTHSLNIVANWAKTILKKGDVILTTKAEHHSNLIPWKIIAKETGAKLDLIEVDTNGMISINSFKERLTSKVKLVPIFHASNVTGQVLPVKVISKLAKKVGAYVVVDGAQAVPHFKVGVQNLECDFYAFSGHKMLGPTGTGVLWAKRELLEKMEPSEYGGGMVLSISGQEIEWAKVPQKLEAGTPNIAGVIGLGAAIDYLVEVGMGSIQKHEKDLLKYAQEKLGEIEDLKIIGPSSIEDRSGLISFVIEGLHPHDIASVLSSQGVCVRAGRHCTIPLHKRLGIPASTRASFYLYNSNEDVDSLVAGIKKAISILK